MEAQAQQHADDLEAKRNFANSKQAVKMALRVNQVVGLKANMTHIELDKLIIDKLCNTVFSKYEIKVK